MKSPNRTVNESFSRESNFDLLRIICALAVVAIHVSAQFIGRCLATHGMSEWSFMTSSIAPYGTFYLGSLSLVL